MRAADFHVSSLLAGKSCHIDNQIIPSSKNRTQFSPFGVKFK